MESSGYHEICWSCMNKYVGIQTTDGHSFDGFIAHVDKDYVTLAVPTDEMAERLHGLPTEQSMYRQFGYYPGFFPRRRFYRRRIPLPLIAGLYLLPFFF